MKEITRISGKRLQGKSVQEVTKKLIATILITLFAYTSFSNLIEHADFKSQLLVQPFTDWLSAPLAWLIPLAGLIAAALLLSKRTRLAGFYAALTLLVFFTVYMVLVLINAFAYVPCACVGVLENSNWAAQFSFNGFFILLSLAGIRLTNKRKEES